ncbi:lysophospholipid acyltransferase family protein [soil metagenome]
MVDVTYPIVVAATRTWLKLGAVDLRMTGTERIPKKGGALLAINHLGFVDYLLAGYPGEEVGRHTRFMAKKEVFDHRIGGPVMRSLGNISIDRSDGEQGIQTAVQALRDGELVGIYPEGTISRSFLLQPLKTGAVRIAAEAEVPLIPIVLWGTQRFVTKGKPRDFKRHKTVGISVGEPMFPTGEDPLAETAHLQATMEQMLDELIRKHPAAEQPPGSWWLPAKYGGSAPTLEEAARMYAEERRLRAERRAAKAAKKK